eukprot:12575459-Alexandrium_andersonii.AAC.1
MGAPRPPLGSGSAPGWSTVVSAPPLSTREGPRGAACWAEAGLTGASAASLPVQRSPSERLAPPQ